MVVDAYLNLYEGPLDTVVPIESESEKNRKEKIMLLKRSFRKTAAVIILLIITAAVYSFFSAGSSPSLSAKRIKKDIIHCLDTDDAQGLKNMLSDNISGNSGIDDQLNKVMELYNGKCVSDDSIRTSISDTDDNGDKHDSLYLDMNVKTDSGKHYDIYVNAYTYSSDPMQEGIYSFTIKDKDGTEYKIG